MDEPRCDRQPALFLVAQELCCLDMTDGFCSPRTKNACQCWTRANLLLQQSGFSAQALAWILRNRTRIEAEAAKAIAGVDAAPNAVDGRGGGCNGDKGAPQQ